MGDKIEALMRELLVEIDDAKDRAGRSAEGRLLAIQRTHVETALAFRLASAKLVDE